MMSFDEFHAVQKRIRARKQEENARKQQPTARRRTKQTAVDGNTDDDSAGEKGVEGEGEERSGLTIGSFLEMQETQTAVIIVALLDMLTAIVQLILQSKGVSQTDTTVEWLLHNGLQAFNSFTLFFYGLELLATFVAFGWGTLAHFGYMFDTVLLVCVVAAQAYGLGTECRLLGVYRLWRVARLVTHLVDLEKAAHTETQLLLQEKEEQLEASKASVGRLEAEVRSEQEARRAVESTLRQYKDEVDLLHEALQEAARDVAIAGLEAELEEEEEEGHDDEEVEDDDAGAEKAEIEAGDEQKSSDAGMAVPPADPVQEPQATVPSAAATGGKKKTPRRHAPTIIIHEDGTFDKH